MFERIETKVDGFFDWMNEKDENKIDKFLKIGLMVGFLVGAVLVASLAW